MRRIFSAWWPLALSWMLMALELPALTIVVARLANPEINLAAYGGVVFPLALIIESPIIMLLAASTALSKDWASYQRMWRFMMTTSAFLTGIHILIAFTPLYYFIARNVLGAPEAIIEPARLGLMLMTPWTWSIAYRRFHQGVLIRFGRSQTVSVGTGVRLGADVLVLTIGYLLQTVPGIAVATAAVACGVLSEAVYVGIVVRPVLRGALKQAPPVEPSLTWNTFISFYTPLVLTSLLTLIAQPLGSAAISRMPQALESLAVWPVLSGLVFLFRSGGFAYNEVVVALLDEPGAAASLRRFTVWLAAATTTLLLLLAATPLSVIWFEWISALNPELASLARAGLWLALPLPPLAALQSWFQGNILHKRDTKVITEAVVLYLLVIAGLLGGGILWGKIPGLYVGIAAMGGATLAQTGWMWARQRKKR